MSPPTADPARVLRAGAATLAGASIAATAAELAMERHWNGTAQLLPWAFLTVAAVALALVVVRPSSTSLWAARLLALGVVVGAAIGIGVHVHANYLSGPLDRDYTDRWATMSEVARWWAAASKSVGPSPTLAPAALAFAGLLVALATVGSRGWERRSGRDRGR